MQLLRLLTKLNEEQPNGVLTEGSLDLQVVGEVASIAILHDQKDIRLRLLAVEQGHHIVVVQLGQLFEDFDFLAQKVLRLGEALLGDGFDSDGETRFLKAKSRVNANR